MLLQIREALAHRWELRAHRRAVAQDISVLSFEPLNFGFAIDDKVVKEPWVFISVNACLQPILLLFVDAQRSFVR